MAGLQARYKGMIFSHEQLCIFWLVTDAAFIRLQIQQAITPHL
jgi:hypothetical protein